MQQAHGKRYNILPGQFTHCAQNRRLVERCHDLAIPCRAFGNFARQAARHDGRRPLKAKIVVVVTRLAAHQQYIAKARRRQQAGLATLAFDDGIGDQRGGVRNAADAGNGHAGARAQFIDAFEEGTSRIIGRSEAFADIQLPGGALEQGEIGEGAADIDADNNVCFRGHCGFHP